MNKTKFFISILTLALIANCSGPDNSNGDSDPVKPVVIPEKDKTPLLEFKDSLVNDRKYLLLDGTELKIEVAPINNANPVTQVSLKKDGKTEKVNSSFTIREEGFYKIYLDENNNKEKPITLVVVKRTGKEAVTGIGLENMGNTCYMNSALKTLSSVSALWQELINASREQVKEDKAAGKAKEARDREEFTNCFEFLMTVIWEGNANFKNSENNKNLMQYFIDEFNKIVELQGENAKELKVTGKQKDAEEFLSGLINILSPKEITEKIKFYITTLNFEDETVVRGPKDEFITLRLDISDQSGKTVSKLEEALQKYLSKKQLEEGSSAKNEYEQIFITKAPDIAIVQLGRYKEIGDRQTVKNQDKVIIPPILEIPIFEKAKVKMNPKAVIKHGGSLSGGHYTAYVKGTDGNWYYHNDETVSPYKGDISDGAYIIFYEKAEVQA